MLKNKQVANLFLCSFIILFVGMGLLPLLPIYAAQFGATPTVAGFYLAVVYTANAIGSMLTSWLARRLTRKGLFTAAGLLGVPALMLLGQATTLWHVVLLTAILWCCGGIGMALINVFTGLSADSKNRGASFSLMSLPMPLGMVLGGLAVSGLVTWHGYQLMFTVLGAVWLALPVIGLLGLEDKHVPAPVRPALEAGGAAWRGQTFLLLLLAALLSSTAIYFSRLGTSLSMQALHFSPGAIASTAAASGIIAIPAILLIGVLSDRLGRRRFLILSCALTVCGALSLTAATELWQFWLASTMFMIAGPVNASVAPALATDILAPEALAQGLPWLKTVGAIASVLGFASAGYVMDTLGGTSLYVIAAALAIVAVPLLGLLPRPKDAVWPRHALAGSQPPRSRSRTTMLTAWLRGRATR